MAHAYARIDRNDAAEKIIGMLRAGANYLSFDEIQRATGLSRLEVALLKPELEQRLDTTITSRVDLSAPGLFFHDN